MADEQHQTPRVAIPGSTSGRPHFEKSPHFRLYQIVTGFGQPRLYDEVATQWYAVAQELDDMRSALGSLDVQTVACGARYAGDEGDETPQEAAWNDALEEMLFGRLRVETADGYDEGLSSWLAWLVYPACWGAGFASPYYEDEGGMMSGSPLYVRPLELSAVDRFDAERGALTPKGFWYRPASIPQDYIKYDDVVHVTTVGSRPGHWYGWNPVFRSLASVFVRWRDLVLKAAASYMTAGGVLVAQQKAGAGTVAEDVRIGMLGRLKELEDGLARAIVITEQFELSVLSPGGSMPDWRAQEEGLVARVKERFANAAATLGLSTHGSRAVSETMGEDDQAKAARRRNALVNRGWMRLAQWVARQEGYTGRIRTLTTVEEEAQMDAGTIGGLAQARQAGLLSWTPTDEERIRERMGLASMEEAGLLLDTVEDGGTVLVGALQQQSEIIARLTPVDPTVAPLAPEVATSLLVKTGFSQAEAEAAVDAQLSFMTSKQAGEARRAANSTSGIQASERSGSRRSGTRMRLSDDDADDDSEPEIFRIASPGGDRTHYRPAISITVHGTEIRPELYHAWAEEDERRATLDAAIRSQIAEVADEHRNAVWGVLEDMTRQEYTPDHPDLVAVYEDYRGRYDALIDGYVERVRQSAYDETARAANRQIEQVDPGAREPLDVSVIAREADDAAEAARNAATLAAETTANRVQAEVEQAWNSRVRPSAFTSRISEAGLATQAMQAANQAEGAGSLQAATSDETMPDGWRIVALTRVSMMDGVVCGPCRAEDGRTFIESEDGTLVDPDTDEPWSEYQDLPDRENCEGRGNCRCRFQATYGRT